MFCIKYVSNLTPFFTLRYVVPKPRADCTKSEQLVVTFTAGYIAGVFCAIVSHPADTVVSKLNQAKGSSAGDIVRELGFMGLWKGLVARIIMIGTLTAAQWFIYDAVKVALGKPISHQHFNCLICKVLFPNCIVFNLFL